MSDSTGLPNEQDNRTPGFKIESLNLIVCEGNADQQFLENLISARRLGNFQVMIAKPDPSDTNSGGKSRFRSFLQALEIPLSQSNLLANIILVSDNDLDPSASFQDIQKQIRNSGLFNPPSKPLRRARRNKKNAVSLFVMMIPWTKKKGTLEHLILEALYDVYPNEKKCVEFYYECMRIEATENKRAKILTQCMITALSRDDPNCGVGHMWGRRNGFQKLLANPAFDQIADFLQKFSV
jgi:hypothetical protein